MALKKRNILLKKPAKGGTPEIEKNVIAKQTPIKGLVFEIIVISSMYLIFFSLVFLRIPNNKQKLDIDIRIYIIE